MNDNEKVIVGMILDRLQVGEGTISSLWNILHTSTQNMVKGKVSWNMIRGAKRLEEVVDLSTDSRKMKAVNAFQELLK